jgi:hypothetical protein
MLLSKIYFETIFFSLKNYSFFEKITNELRPTSQKQTNKNHYYWYYYSTYFGDHRHDSYLECSSQITEYNGYNTNIDNN